MTFTTLALTGGRVLVKGTDHTGTAGETVVDGSEWAQVKRQAAHAEATEAFDDAVNEFFGPLMAAAEQLEDSLAIPAPDEISYFVIDEGEEGTAGREPSVIKLSRDSIVLRLLERGQGDRLVWVAGDLEILEVLPGTSNTGATPDHGDLAEDTPVEV